VRRVRCLLGRLAVLVASIFLCRCDGQGRIRPGRIESYICDSRTGGGIPGAKVIVNVFVGNWDDETPCSRPLIRAGTGGVFSIPDLGARRIEVEAVAPGYHSMGWVYAGQTRFCLEPIVSDDLLEVHECRVGFEDGRPFGYSFSEQKETFDRENWDVGPDPDLLWDLSAPVELRFRGGGGVALTKAVPYAMTAHYFQYDFEPPTSGYRERVMVGGERGRSFEQGFFRDAGGKYGKLWHSGMGSGKDYARNWYAAFRYAYAASGAKWVEARVEDLQPRWPECGK
jgi:hypothetical protein